MANTQWEKMTAQKLVRYEALFNLLDDIHKSEDIAFISKQTARQWKYFANVAGWRLVMAKKQGFLVIDGFRGEAMVTEMENLSPWDSHYYDIPHPCLLNMTDPWEGPKAPGHLTGKFISEISVQQFFRMDQRVGLLSVAARHEPFSDLDNRFIRLFANHITDRISGILLRQAAIESLMEKATKDGLTGLLNRATIFEQLQSRYELSVRTCEPLSLILADIDFFKVINDSYGHLAGDQVLKEIARRLQHQTRSGDQVGRYGGEEFLAVLYPCNEAQAKIAAERYRRAVADKPFDLKPGDSRRIDVTISIGTSSTCGQKKARIEALLKRADNALYKSKINGRNQITAAGSIPSTRTDS